MNTTNLAINGRRQLFALLLAASLAVSAFSASYFAAENTSMVNDTPALAGDPADFVG